MTDADKDAEIIRLKKLCAECWGVLITAHLEKKEPSPEVFAALQHIDKRMALLSLPYPNPTRPGGIGRE